MNEREKVLRKAKRKKLLLAIVLVIIGIFAILGAIMLILAGINSFLEDERRKTFEETLRPPSYIFANPKYDEDIFDDAEYMAMNRDMRYKQGALTTTVSEDNYNSQLPVVQFMYDILQYIIHGDYEKYNEIFIDAYLERAGDDLRETFTMQKLYNIEIELIDYREVDFQGKTVIYNDFKVSYMIKNNNGTFRNDIPPEEAYRPVVYRIMTEVDSRESVYDSSVYNLLLYSQYLSGLYD